MSIYAGYGFSAEKISEKSLLEFFLRYDDKERIKDMVSKVLGEEKDIEALTKKELGWIRNAVKGWIREDCGTIADYIADMINAEERFCRRMHDQDIVKVCDEFIVFGPVMFPQDSEERLKRIRKKKDFIDMVKGYFPGEEIVFGPVFDDPDFLRCFWLEADER